MDFLNSKAFYYKTVVITIIVIFIEIILGSYVEGIEAGLSCPQWPLCYGQLVPLDSVHFGPFTVVQVWSEYIHRIVASIVSLLIIFTAYLTYLHKDEVTNANEIPFDKITFAIAIIILILLVIQLLLLGLSFLSFTESTAISTFLADTTLIFGLIILLAFTAYLTYLHKDEVSKTSEIPIGKKKFTITIIFVILLVAQILLGGLTVLSFTDSAVISSHLADAALILGLIILLVFTAYLIYLHKDEFIKIPLGKKRLIIAIILLILLFIQVLLGGLTVLSFTDPAVVSAHLADATLIFGLTIYLFTMVSPQKE